MTLQCVILTPLFPTPEMYRLMKIIHDNEQRLRMIQWLKSQGIKRITPELVDGLITIETRLKESEPDALVQD